MVWSIPVVDEWWRREEGLGMIESEELVTTALAAGAASVVGESAAVRDAYAGVKALTLRVLRRDGSVSTAAVEAVEAELG